MEKPIHIRMNTEKLHLDYCKICNDFITLFEKKQDIEFDFWIGDEVGGLASFASHYFFNLSDIILDITTNQPKGKILKWQDEDLDYNMVVDFPSSITYKSYTMGLRLKDLEVTPFG